MLYFTGTILAATDVTVPTKNSLTASSTVITAREIIPLTGTAIDTESGIVGYVFSQGTETASFTTISATTTEVTHTYEVNEYDTYYYWVKDAERNISKSKYKL